MTSFTRILPVLLLTLLVSLGLVACGQSADAKGGADSAAHTHAAQQLHIRADPNGRLAWEHAEYIAPAGDTTFIIQNPATLPHNFTIEGEGVKAQTKLIQGGASDALTVSGLKPGTYQIACTLPGHRESGMIATLVIR